MAVVVVVISVIAVWHEKATENAFESAAIVASHPLSNQFQA
ncbi:hypothetical protein [Candidatus Coxiella mudrowiae]|nr:hypothetical protein [Candidatus Coxiella mudrowiae]